MPGVCAMIIGHGRIRRNTVSFIDLINAIHFGGEPTQCPYNGALGSHATTLFFRQILQLCPPCPHSAGTFLLRPSVALRLIGGPASAGVADQNQNPKSRGHMHALEIHGALLFVRLFSGNCLGFGYHDNQGIYKELCATYWDCKRL